MREANFGGRISSEIYHFYSLIHKQNLAPNIYNQLRDQVCGTVLNQLNQFDGGLLYRLSDERSQ